MRMTQARPRFETGRGGRKGRGPVPSPRLQLPVSEGVGGAEALGKESLDGCPWDRVCELTSDGEGVRGGNGG